MDAERGIAYEDEAIRAYEFERDVTVKRIGMFKNDLAARQPGRPQVGEDGLP